MDIWNDNLQFLDSIVEKYIQKQMIFESSNDIEEKIVKIFSEDVKNEELKDILTFLEEKYLIDEIDIDWFNKRLNLTWWKVFKRLKYLIDFSLFSIKEWQDLADKNSIKTYLLTKLHAKSLLLANEILTLLKNGYWEWANARWRTLYENNITIEFLITFWNKNNNLFLRFIEHSDILKYKSAESYKNNYKKLKHNWYWKENFIELEKRREELLKKYWKTFNKDYWWISDDITKNLNFKEIEKLVDGEHFRPYFRMSSRWIHSNMNSFQNLWLKEEKIHLIWPSNSWLTDPLQNTALFILRWTSFILLDFIKQIKDDKQKDKLILLFLNKILNWLYKWIWKDCIEIENYIEKQEKHYKKNN